MNDTNNIDSLLLVHDNKDNKQHNPRISISVDEFTIVLQPMKKVDITKWNIKANDIIREFVNKSCLDHLLGGMEYTNEGLVQGYTIGYTTSAGRPYHSVICYHDEFENMGCCFKFSAHAYYEYKQAYFEEYNEPMNIAKFLRMTQSQNYTMRLSRIDMVADFFDMPDHLNNNIYLHPDSIYNSLLHHQVKVVDYNNRSNIRKISAINKDGIYETVYIGSKKSKSRSFMRIYDKKSEQISKHSFRLTDAMSCNSWVRFEACYKDIYAHKIGEDLINGLAIQTDQDLRTYIADKICNKYTFKLNDIDETLTNFSEELLEIASDKDFESLVCESPRDNSLEQSLKYLVKNSGLYITLGKILFVYGTNVEVEKTLEWLSKMFTDYFLKKESHSEYKSTELDKWLKKHSATTKKQSLEDIFAMVELELSQEYNWFCTN